MYRWIDHTAEVELVVEAESEAAVYGEALTAVAELLGRPDPDGPPVRRAIELAERDRPALLAAWLEELVFMSEAHGLICARLVDIELADGAVRAAVEARPGAALHLVKAITYHRLRFERTEDRWIAGAVLDV